MGSVSPVTLLTAGYLQPATAATAGTPTTGKINMTRLMMVNDGGLDEYYYYDGSLTFPADMAAMQPTQGCAEIVRWILPTKKLTMSEAQFNMFLLNNRLDIGHTNNNRDIQGSNDNGGSSAFDNVFSAFWTFFFQISSRASTGRQHSTSSTNITVYIKRASQDVVENFVQHAAGPMIGVLTSLAVNELIRNPPNMESKSLKLNAIADKSTSGILESVMPPPPSSNIPTQSAATIPFNALATNSVQNSAGRNNHPTLVTKSNVIHHQLALCKASVSL